MCKYLGLQFACGCYSKRCLSNCRSTFAYPTPIGSDPSTLPTLPLCKQGATFDISLKDKCIQCQYKDFCTIWEERIAKAHQRGDDISAQLREKYPEQDGWDNADNWDDSDGWSSAASCGNWGAEWLGENDVSPDFCGNIEYDMDGSSDCIYSSDEDSPEKTNLIKERDEAMVEATYLQQEFARENWEIWQSRLFGTDFKEQRRRKIHARVSSGSSLRFVKNAEPSPLTVPDPFLHYRGPVYESSEGTCSPTLSDCSTRSARYSPFGTSDEFDVGNAQGVAEIDEMTMALSEMKYSGNGSVGLEGAGLLENSDEVMLPVWLDRYHL